MHIDATVMMKTPAVPTTTETVITPMAMPVSCLLEFSITKKSVVHMNHDICQYSCV